MKYAEAAHCEVRLPRAEDADVIERALAILKGAGGGGGLTTIPLDDAKT